MQCDKQFALETLPPICLVSVCKKLETEHSN